MNNQWFAVYVKSRFERNASMLLRCRGFEEFLPVYNCRRQWSHRVKTLTLPLFPGYLFCKFDVRDTLSVLTTPGILGIVGHRKTPISLTNAEIDSIHLLVESRLILQPYPYTSIGERVRIEQGPLRSLEGIVVAFKKDLRLVVSVDLLQRSIAVDLDPNWVVPIGANVRAVVTASSL